jgi:CheY-like chemotaxis protein
MMDRPTHLPAILIVDDDAATLSLLTHSIRKLAPTYAILTAEDGQSALNHLAQQTVALLITDYLLPDMNGLELSAAVKAASPQTYVILTSAADTAELQQQAREWHIDTFLSKMDILAGLRKVVRSVLPAE